MARNKKKNDKSNVDTVLDDVLSGQSQDSSQDSVEAEAVETVEETVDNSGQSIGQDSGQTYTETEPGHEHEGQTGVVIAEVSADEWNERVAKAKAEIEAKPSNLVVSVAPKAAEAKSVLLWKSTPAGELEPLLRERAKHHAKMNYGVDVTIAQVDQVLLDRCGTDYRFLREIERLTRKQ